MDYLQLIQKVVNLERENAHSLVICNREGVVEYYKSFENAYTGFSKEFGPSIVGKYVYDVYENLTRESSTVMQVLRTGKTVANQWQKLVVDETTTLSIVSTTVPVIIDGKVLGAIDYTQYCSILKNGTPLPVNDLVTLDNIITADPNMMRLKNSVQRLAWSDTPVLIYGETGTGKELIAESIHTAGKRMSQPFLSQNCAAIPSNLLEGIFFGSEKGSFTGAESRKGLFEMADGGTLFLDEINSMDVSLQVKLLKALEEKKVRRIGGTKDIRFDVRIICAANEPPDKLIREGRMREDLYYRIGVVQFYLPPLRERRGDILLLADYFIQHFNRQMNRNIRGLSHMVASIFETADWPGNVRQLKNVIESAFNLTQGDVISIGDLPEIMRSTVGSERLVEETIPRTIDDILSEMQGTAVDGSRRAAENRGGNFCKPAASVVTNFFSEEEIDALLEGEGFDLQKMLDNYEAYLIRRAIDHEGQLNKAAQKLKISPQRLHYKLDRLNLRNK